MNCRMCGRPLRDRISKLFRVCSDCRKGMTNEQLRAAMAQTRAEAAPGYIPPARPASPRAQQPARATCVHDGMPGACPDCRYEADPANAAARIIREIQAERRTARDAAYRAFQVAHGEQLTLEAS